MTWNLQGSAGPPLDRVAAIVSEHAPDVLVLQEIRRRQAARLARSLGWQVSWHRKHHPYSPLAWWTTEGMALATPHRLDETRATSLTPGIGTWTYRHRVLVEGLVSRSDASAYRVFDVHLASDADGADDRTTQARLAVARIRATGPAPVIVAGDMNEPRGGTASMILADDLRVDAWDVAARRPPGDGPTNPSDSPHQTLDRVLVPDAATVPSVWVPEGGAEWAEISDHLPVVVTFDMAWATGDLV